MQSGILVIDDCKIKISVNSETIEDALHPAASQFQPRPNSSQKNGHIYLISTQICFHL